MYLKYSETVSLSPIPLSIHVSIHLSISRSLSIYIWRRHTYLAISLSRYHVGKYVYIHCWHFMCKPHTWSLSRGSALSVSLSRYRSIYRSCRHKFCIYTHLTHLELLKRKGVFNSSTINILLSREQRSNKSWMENEEKGEKNPKKSPVGRQASKTKMVRVWVWGVSRCSGSLNQIFSSHDESSEKKGYHHCNRFHKRT